MAACAEVVSEMTHWKSMEDTALERLDEWDRWMSKGPRVGPKEPHCTLGRIQEQRVAAGAASGPRDIPRTVDEVERALKSFSPRERKIVSEYYSHSVREVKARNCGLTPNGFWRAFQRVLRRLYSELY